MCRLRWSDGFLFFVCVRSSASRWWLGHHINRRLLPSSFNAGAAGTVLAILLVCGGFTVIRTGGITANFENDIHWRWSKTPEEELLAKTGDEPATPISTTAAVTGTNWPGFRGAERDGIVRGARIKTDWSAAPPVELWRRPIGPGWSSFAVHGDFVYTQEQRGDQEVVACYNVSNGKLVWKHGDAVRFWESCRRGRGNADS